VPWGTQRYPGAESRSSAGLARDPCVCQDPSAPTLSRPSVPRCPRSIAFCWRGFFRVQPGAFTSSRAKHHVQLLEWVLGGNEPLHSRAKAAIRDRCQPSFPWWKPWGRHLVVAPPTPLPGVDFWAQAEGKGKINEEGEFSSAGAGVCACIPLLQ